MRGAAAVGTLPFVATDDEELTADAFLRATPTNAAPPPGSRRATDETAVTPRAG